MIRRVRQLDVDPGQFSLVLCALAGELFLKAEEVFGPKEEGGSSEGRLLHIEKRRITQSQTEITLVVDEEPVRAGIDPYHKLVDRNPENNLTRVTAAGS